MNMGTQNYIRYDMPLLMLLYMLNITLVYAMLTITLTRYAYYNITIRYNIILLMSLFDVLLGAVGFWNFHTMFTRLIQVFGSALRQKKI